MIKRFRAATISLAGVTATVVQVPSYVVHNPAEANRLSSVYGAQFPGSVIILAAMAGPRPIYFGNRNLIAVLRRAPSFRMPWQDHKPMAIDGGSDEIGSIT